MQTTNKTTLHFTTLALSSPFSQSPTTLPTPSPSPSLPLTSHTLSSSDPRRTRSSPDSLCSFGGWCRHPPPHPPPSWSRPPTPATVYEWFWSSWGLSLPTQLTLLLTKYAWDYLLPGVLSVQRLHPLIHKVVQFPKVLLRESLGIVPRPLPLYDI